MKQSLKNLLTSLLFAVPFLNETRTNFPCGTADWSLMSSIEHETATSKLNNTKLYRDHGCAENMTIILYRINIYLYLCVGKSL